jgi:thiol-disulfide isomerase/thioredoxin
MKNFFVLLFLAIITISVVFFNALDNRPLRLKENARFIAVQYFAQNCPDCQELNHKMHKINWLFGRKPINFLRYDLSNPQTIQQFEAQLQNAHLGKIVRQNQQLKQVIFFDIKTQKPVLALGVQDDLRQMEGKINRLLGE